MLNNLFYVSDEKDSRKHVHIVYYFFVNVSFGTEKKYPEIYSYCRFNIIVLVHVCMHKSITRNIYTRFFKKLQKSWFPCSRFMYFQTFFYFLNFFQFDINYTCIYFHISTYVRNSVRNIIQIPSMIKINFL